MEVASVHVLNPPSFLRRGLRVCGSRPPKTDARCPHEIAKRGSCRVPASPLACTQNNRAPDPRAHIAHAPEGEADGEISAGEKRKHTYMARAIRLITKAARLLFGVDDASPRTRVSILLLGFWLRSKIDLTTGTESPHGLHLIGVIMDNHRSCAAPQREESSTIPSASPCNQYDTAQRKRGNATHARPIVNKAERVRQYCGVCTFWPGSKLAINTDGPLLAPLPFLSGPYLVLASTSPQPRGRRDNRLPLGWVFCGVCINS